MPTIKNVSTPLINHTVEVGFAYFLSSSGPSLTAFGVPDALGDPTLELRDGNGVMLASDNNWEDNPSQAAELVAAGLAPTVSLESGIAATLAAGSYTALLVGQSNGAGVGLVEVYDRRDSP